MATIPNMITPEELFAEDMFAIGLSPYDEQVEMIGLLAHGLTAKPKAPVALVEAPTGTGKTHVITQHALQIASENNEIVIIAVPTIEIANQTLEVLQDMSRARRSYSKIRMRVVLGRQEFVGRQALDRFADRMETTGEKKIADTMRAWHSGGGRSKTAGYPDYSRSSLEFTLKAAGYIINLGGHIELGHDIRDPAHEAHQAQFNDDADIYIVTHSMLGRDLSRRYISAAKIRKLKGLTLTAGTGLEAWREAHEQRLSVESEAEGRLPDYQRLIIDEAHLLRRNLELSMTGGLSVHQLHAHVATLRKSYPRKVHIDVVTSVATVLDRLSAHPSRSEGQIGIDWADSGEIGDAVEELNEAIGRIKLTKEMIDTVDGAAVRNAGYLLREATSQHGQKSTKITWSPKREFPSITVGKKDIRSEVSFMFDRLASSSLISATLYTENQDGPSAEHIRQELGISAERAVTYEPIRSPWLTKPVTIMIPTSALAQEFIPPRPGEDEDDWLDHIVDQVITAHQHERSRKGTLVLCTSRSNTADISERLVNRLESRYAVIDGTKSSLPEGKAMFMEMARRRKRPIWITQGPAWTGLDLPDNTLGNLIIVKLPFPQPIAGTTAGKEAIYQGRHVAQMMMSLKQGLGRLVRTRHSTRKKAWILDGRIHGSGPAAAAMGLFKGYSQKNF